MMNFIVKLDDLKSQVFQYIPTEPKKVKIGRQKFAVFVAYDPAFELIHVELRLVMKGNDHAKP